jgi:hypothetical protein
MSCSRLLLLPLLLAACVNFRVPQDGPDLAYDGFGEGLSRDGFGEAVDPERTYPETFEGYDPSWCAYAELATLASGTSFFVDAPEFVALGDQFASVDVVCPTPGQGGEEVYRLEAPVGTGLRVRLEADWGAMLTLTQGGCRVGHVTACHASDLLDVFDAGRLYLFVEASGEEARPGAYRLQVALNHGAGYAPCPSDREVGSSSFAAAPVLVDEAGQAYREVRLDGDTTLARDRFYLPCANGAPPDTFGGAPDHVIALSPDFADERPRRAELRLETGGLWQGVLTVTGAPCGATTEALDCDADPAGAVIRDLLLLPGAPVYAVIDGKGDDVPAGRAGGAYSLRVRLYEP